MYTPRACPISATPAALPTDRSDPPTPAVNVTSSHSDSDIGGCISSTENMTGMLSMTAESTPTSRLARVAPRSVYSHSERPAR